MNEVSKDLQAIPWEVRDNYPYPDGKVEMRIERHLGQETEVGAICWDYGLACVIEAALNMRDGTVE